MKLNKVKVCQAATMQLRRLKGITGLTPNFLCRFALLYSLTEPRIPDHTNYDSEGQEFNRYTLLGEWDFLFVALLKERCIEDGLNLEKDLKNQFIAHLNRGIKSIYDMNMKSLSDIIDLIPEEIYKNFKGKIKAA